MPAEMLQGVARHPELVPRPFWWRSVRSAAARARQAMAFVEGTQAVTCALAAMTTNMPSMTMPMIPKQ